MTLAKHFLLILNLVVGLNCEAQNSEAQTATDSTSTWNLLKLDSRNTWGGIKHSMSRPAHWKGKDFTKLGILIAGTASLTLVDENANSFFTKQEQDIPQGLKDFGWYFGSPQNYFMLNARLYGFGLITKNEKIRKTSVLIISASVTNGFLHSFTKTVFGRARPNSGYDPHEFRFLSSEGDFHSFPSGHTALSVTMAHAIAKQFDNTWAKIAIYSVGAIPPLSRLTANAHWLSDVAFSTALSIIIVDSVDKFLHKNTDYNYEKSKHKITWNLAFKPNQIGVIGRF